MVSSAAGAAAAVEYSFNNSEIKIIITFDLKVYKLLKKQLDSKG
jgi:hypothetical protein